MKSIMTALLRAPIFIFVAVLVSSMPAPAHAQDFIAFEGKNAVKEGEGGAKKTVEGVEFWSDGAPPRKFRLLGYVTDRRQKNGLLGMARMSSLEKDVAEVVKNNGGDAAILMASEAETVGMIGNAFATGNRSAFGTSVGVQKQNSKYAVVKYLAEGEIAEGKKEAQPASYSPVAAPLSAPSAQATSTTESLTPAASK